MSAPLFVSATTNAAGTQVSITYDQDVNLGAGAPTVTVGTRLTNVSLTGLSVAGAVLTGTIPYATHGGPIHITETLTVTSPVGVVTGVVGGTNSTAANNQAVTNASTVAFFAAPPAIIVSNSNVQITLRESVAHSEQFLTPADESYQQGEYLFNMLHWTPDTVIEEFDIMAGNGSTPGGSGDPCFLEQGLNNQTWPDTDMTELPAHRRKDPRPVVVQWTLTPPTGASPVGLELNHELFHVPGGAAVESVSIRIDDLIDVSNPDKPIHLIVAIPRNDLHGLSCYADTTEATDGWTIQATVYALSATNPPHPLLSRLR